MAYDHLAALLPDAVPEVIRTRLGRFGFGQDKAFVPIASLSGGERARLNLALVTHDAPALLILDEPTNHLDMETRESLVEALAEYSGAVVLVSHDWHLVELVADRLWLVEERHRRRRLTAISTLTAAASTSATWWGTNATRSGQNATPSAPRGARRRRRAWRSNRCAANRSGRKRRPRGLRRSNKRSIVSLPRRTASAPGRALTDALKRRADLARRIAEAEAQWVAAEEAIERAAGD